MSTAATTSLLRAPGLLVVGFAWMPALWIYKTGRYANFGGLLVPAVCIALAFLVLGVTLERMFGRPPTPKVLVGMFAVSLLDAGLWAPVLNGALDFREPVVLDANVEIRAGAGPKRQDLRFVSLEHEGRALQTEIDPRGFWATRAVREGGACRVALGRGALGAPWPAAIRDP